MEVLGSKGSLLESQRSAINREGLGAPGPAAFAPQGLTVSRSAKPMSAVFSLWEMLLM